MDVNLSMDEGELLFGSEWDAVSERSVSACKQEKISPVTSSFNQTSHVLPSHPDSGKIAFPQERYCPEAKPEGMPLMRRHESQRIRHNSRELVNEWRSCLQSSNDGASLRYGIVSTPVKRRSWGSHRRKSIRTPRRQVRLPQAPYNYSQTWQNETPRRRKPTTPRFSTFCSGPVERGHPTPRTLLLNARRQKLHCSNTQKKRIIHSQIRRMCLKNNVRPIFLGKKVIIRLDQPY